MTLSIALEPAPIETDAQGVVRVAKTRVTLNTVMAAFLEGCLPEEIVEQYPSLHLPNVHLVIGYYLRHRDEGTRLLRRTPTAGKFDSARDRVTI